MEFQNAEKINHSAGENEEQILESHPRLTHEAIRASLAFAAQALRADVVYPVAERMLIGRQNKEESQ